MLFLHFGLTPLFFITHFLYCPVLKERLDTEAPDEIKQNPEFMILACKNDDTVGELIGDVPGGLWNNNAFVEGAVAEQPRILRYVPHAQQRQIRFRDLYLQNLKRLWYSYASNTNETLGCSEEMKTVLEEFPDVAMEFVRCGFYFDLDELSEAALASYKENLNLVLEVAKSCGSSHWRQDFYDALKRANSPLLQNMEFLAEAAKHDGSIILFTEERVDIDLHNDMLLTAMACTPNTDSTTRLAYQFPDCMHMFQSQLAGYNIWNDIVKEKLSKYLPREVLDKISNFLVNRDHVDRLRQVRENLVREKAKPPSLSMITQEQACLKKLKEAAEKVSVCFGKMVNIQITLEDSSAGPSVQIQNMSDDGSVVPPVSNRARPNKRRCPTTS